MSQDHHARRKRRRSLYPQDRDLYLRAYSAKDEASFFDFNEAVLVPIDALDTYYPVEEASDFWDVVGRNTDYVFAPEECMADNFGFTVVYGLDGQDYQTPQLIANIYNALCNYQPGY